MIGSEEQSSLNSSKVEMSWDHDGSKLAEAEEIIKPLVNLGI